MKRHDNTELVDVRTTELLDKLGQAYQAGFAVVDSIGLRLKRCIEVGQLLRQKKSVLAHGQWTEWFEKQVECTEIAKKMDFTLKTAQRWMRLAEMAEFGISMEEAGTVKRAYQLAGIMPDSDEGTLSSGTSGPQESMPLVKLKRLSTIVEAELVRHPIEKWTVDEREQWRQRLRPLAALYKALE